MFILPFIQSLQIHIQPYDKALTVQIQSYCRAIVRKGDSKSLYNNCLGQSPTNSKHWTHTLCVTGWPL